MNGGTAAVAALPMYDWPELRTETDRFWDNLRDSLLSFGFPAPVALDRDRAGDEIWHDENLLLAQTCGLPFVTDLTNSVTLVGTPAYELECGAGSYYSVILVRADCPAQSLDELAGLRLAYNSRNSQSGYAALAYALRDRAGNDPFFASGTRTGAHRASIQSVAQGQADVAAIDAVTWQIAQRHETTAQALRVLTSTEPTPGLPFICAKRPDWRPDRIHLAVVEAMAALDEDCRQALLLAGFQHTMPSDYEVIRAHYELAKNVSL